MKQTTSKSNLFGNFSKEASIQWLFITERKQLKGERIYCDSWSQELVSSFKWGSLSGFIHSDAKHHGRACSKAKWLSSVKNGGTKEREVNQRQGYTHGETLPLAFSSPNSPFSYDFNSDSTHG